jgi:hypothetical protein
VPENPPGTLGLARDPALVSLSRDHHTALVHAQAMRRAGDGAAPQNDPGAPARVGQAFLAFHQTELLGHMADEEEILLPRGGSADPEGAERIRAEHAELKALVSRLADALASGEGLRPLLKQIGVLLDDHVRFEERAFFMAVQAMLTPPAMGALGRALYERRSARGVGAACNSRARTRR